MKRQKGLLNKLKKKNRVLIKRDLANILTMNQVH